MMTNDEFTAAQARITEADTELAGLAQLERDCIEKAREFNDARRAAGLKRIALAKAVEPLRNAVREHIDQVNMELKRQANERAKAEAAAKAKAEAEREQTELERLRAENEALKAKINQGA